jgi:hypothetical protein
MGFSQNLSVFQDGTTYRVITEYSHDEVFSSDRADQTIQYAVDAMAAGDPGGGVVTVGRGAFPLDGSVYLRDRVWLRGSGRGTRLLVDGAGEDGAGVVAKDVKGCVISDLSLLPQEDSNGGTGVILDSAGDCKVRDVVAARFENYGIWVRNNTFLSEVRGCTVAGNMKANLYLDQLARGTYGDFVPNLVSNCVTYGGGKGIDCNRTIVLNIVGCVVYQSGDVAYHVRNTSNSVVISGCRSFQITGHAVMVEDSHEFNLSSNIFCWHTGHGVLVRDCNWGTITGNEIIDSGSYNAGTRDTETQVTDLPEEVPAYNGIDLIHSQGFTVSSNAVFNWPVAPHMGIGIREDERCSHNAIVGNNVNYYVEEGIVSQGAESVVENNVCEKDKPYQSPQAVNTTVQSFQRTLTETFIDELTT